ncbi:MULTISPECIES: hypothetical protein [unclassified Undibacterium]|nr:MULTISPECIES: hypothetical protein [unclassified Undibacterium]MEB0259672.1 hypothetical protein [Undibacterium sp. 5I1]
MRAEADSSNPMPTALVAITTAPKLAVYSWPDLLPEAVEAFHQHKSVVISVVTEITTLRDQARLQIRHALRDLFSQAFSIPQEQVRIVGSAGQALSICINSSDTDKYAHEQEIALGVSISHEPGLSIAAISFQKNIGIDLMRVDLSLDWRDVTQLYLGDEVYKKIAGQTVQHQLLMFAQEWTMQEARLKSQGLALSEWHPDLAARLKKCRTILLDLPSGYVGAIAF